MRVVSLAGAPADDDGEPAAEAPAPPPEPSYAWFSIIGTAGALEAGVSDGAGGGARVWFVREGDRLPGAVTVERIVARPPGVHVGGGAGTALPYRPRPTGAVAAGGSP